MNFSTSPPCAVHRGDDRIGIVVEQRDDLLGRRRVGDPREALQVAEPQHGADLLGDAALDVAAQHAMPGVAPEVGLDQRLGDARDRGALDREREARAPGTRARRGRRSAKPDGRSVAQEEKVQSIRPIAPCGAEAVDHRHVVGHARAAAARPGAGTAAARWRGGGAASSRRSRRAGGTGSAAICRSLRRDRAGRTRTGPGRRASRCQWNTRPSSTGCSVSTPNTARPSGRPAASARSQKPCSRISCALAGQAGGGEPLDQWRKARVVHGRDFVGWSRGRAARRALLPERRALLKPAAPDVRRLSISPLLLESVEVAQRRMGALAPCRTRRIVTVSRCIVNRTRYRPRRRP